MQVDKREKALRELCARLQAASSIVAHFGGMRQAQITYLHSSDGDAGGSTSIGGGAGRRKRRGQEEEEGEDQDTISAVSKHNVCRVFLSAPHQYVAPC